MAKNLKFGGVFDTSSDGWKELCEREEAKRQQQHARDDSEAIRKRRQQALSSTGEATGKEGAAEVQQSVRDPPELKAVLPALELAESEIRRSTSHKYEDEDWIQLANQIFEVSLVDEDGLADTDAAQEFCQSVNAALSDYVTAIQQKLYP